MPRGSPAARSLSGGAGDDTLTGGNGADSLIGGDGNDTLEDAASNDTLLGGNGNDEITDIDGSNSLDGQSGTDVTVDGVAKALASFERTLLSGSSLWDRHLVAIKAGVPEQSPLSPAQKRGLDLFYGKARCASCHGGPDLTDHDFHNVGVGIQDGRLIDAGRFKVVRSELVGHVDASLTGAFKTPTLRDIARTAPYMHDGSLQTLREVMAYFNGGITSNPHLDEQLTADGRMGTAPRMLGLSQDELADLEQFLLALTGEPIVIDPPQLPGSEPAAAVDHAPRSKQTTTSRSAQAGGG